MDSETIKKMQDFHSMLKFRDEINQRYVRGFGKTSLMLKHFQEMKKQFKIDKTDEEFIKELKENGFVLICPSKEEQQPND